MALPPSSSPVTIPTGTTTAAPIAPSSASVSSAFTVPPFPRFWFVLNYVLRDTDGRDKLLKLFQYGGRFMRMLIHRREKQFDTILRMVEQAVQHWLQMPALSLSSRRMVDSLESMAASLSACRRLIRLGKWVYTLPILHKAYYKWKFDLSQLTQAKYLAVQQSTSVTHSAAPNSVRVSTPALLDPPLPILVSSSPSSPLFLLRFPLLSSVQLFHAAISVLTDLLEDVEWLSSHGLMPRRIGLKCSAAAVRLWFAAVLIDLALTLRTLRQQHKLLLQHFDRLQSLRRQWRQRDRQSQSQASLDSLISRELSDSSTYYRLVGDSILTFLKFLGDLGVAMPSALHTVELNQMTVQASGFMAAAVGIFKLAKIAK
jgi:hypothetical protein